MTPILLRLHSTTLEELDRASAIKDVTRTSLIRNALNYYLNYFQDHEEPKLIQMKESGQSIYEKMFMGK